MSEPHQHGSATVFYSLNRRFRPALVAFFMRRLPAPTVGDAEDLTQEVFARLATMKGQVESPDSYIFTVATNLLRDRARRDQVRTRHLIDAKADPEAGLDFADPERVTAGKQQVESLVQALRELPETTRDIFVLYRLEGLDRRDLATSYGVSLSTVDRHLQTAMVHLTKRLKVTE